MRNSEIKLKAKEDLKDNWGMAIILLLLAVIVSVITSSIGLGICGAILSGIVSLYLSNYFLSLARNNSIKEFNDIFKEKFNFLSAIVSCIILLLISLAIILIPTIFFVIYLAGLISSATNEQVIGIVLINALGYIIIVLPIISTIINLRFKFVYHIMSEDHSLSGMECMKASWNLTRGKMLRILCFEISFVGWYLLTALTFGILSVYVAPYYNCASANLYLEICKEKDLSYRNQDITYNKVDEDDIEVIG